MQCAPSESHHGAFDTFRKIVRNEVRQENLVRINDASLCLQGILALYKGVTPQAVGWGIIDSVLLGSLHNYRLFFLRQGMTEEHPISRRQRLTLLGHGVAGLFAGLTRSVHNGGGWPSFTRYLISAVIATPFELLKGVSLEVFTRFLWWR